MNPLENPRASARSAVCLRLLVLMAVALGATALVLHAEQPIWWWVTWGAVNPNATQNDGAAATVGQLKGFTQQAVNEMNADLSGFGAGSSLNNLVNGWKTDYQILGYSGTNPMPSDFQVVSVGQLKYIGSLVWGQLQSAGYTGSLPSWLVVNPAVDGHASNLGQLKTVFNFDLTYCSGTDGLPDWWVEKYYGTTNGQPSALDPNAFVPWSGGLITNLQAYQQGLNPIATTPTFITLSASLPAGVTNVALSWSDQLTTETGYAIFRETGASGFQQIGIVGAGVKTYSDYAVQGSTTYTYEVAALNGLQQSAPGTQVTITTLLDSNGDGIADIYKPLYGIDPNDGTASAGGSGLPDGWLIQYGLNPLTITNGNVDLIGKGWTLWDDYNNGTNPNLRDTDGDGVPDCQDGWPLEPLLSTPRLPVSNYAVIKVADSDPNASSLFGPDLAADINSKGQVLYEDLNTDSEYIWSPTDPQNPVPTPTGYNSMSDNGVVVAMDGTATWDSVAGSFTAIPYPASNTEQTFNDSFTDEYGDWFHAGAPEAPYISYPWNIDFRITKSGHIWSIAGFDAETNGLSGTIREVSMQGPAFDNAALDWSNILSSGSAKTICETGPFVDLSFYPQYTCAECYCQTWAGYPDSLAYGATSYYGNDNGDCYAWITTEQFKEEGPNIFSANIFISSSATSYVCHSAAHGALQLLNNFPVTAQDARQLNENGDFLASKGIVVQKQDGSYKLINAPRINTIDGSPSIDWQCFNNGRQALGWTDGSENNGQSQAAILINDHAYALQDLLPANWLLIDVRKITDTGYILANAYKIIDDNGNDIPQSQWVNSVVILVPVEPSAPVIYMFSGHDSDTVTLDVADIPGCDYKWQLKNSGGAQGQFQNSEESDWNDTGTTSTVTFRAGKDGTPTIAGDTRAQASGSNTIQLLISGTVCWEKPLQVIPIQPRSSWGALAADTSTWAGMTGINQLTVHHSSKEAFGIAEIQRIQKEHKGLLNGTTLWYTVHPHENWGDIGYHFILDPSNDSDPNTVLLYEGRQLEGLGLTGGQYTVPAAVKLKNTLSGIDICILGNYQAGSFTSWMLGSETFSELRREKLEKVLAALSVRYKTPPANGAPAYPPTTPPISYHQKLAQQPPVSETTECPGSTVISTMPTTQTKVQNDLR